MMLPNQNQLIMLPNQNQLIMLPNQNQLIMLPNQNQLIMLPNQNQLIMLPNQNQLIMPSNLLSTLEIRWLGSQWEGTGTEPMRHTSKSFHTNPFIFPYGSLCHQAQGFHDSNHYIQIVGVWVFINVDASIKRQPKHWDSPRPQIPVL